MKKIFCLILILISIFCLTGCNKQSKYIKDINLNEFKEMVANKKTFVIYVGNDNCSHCVSYMPVLEDVLKKYNIVIYHMDNSKLSEKKYGEFKTYVNVSGTPTIAFIKNGEEESTLNRIVGETSKEDTIERFKLNGYIK